MNPPVRTLRARLCGAVIFAATAALAQDQLLPSWNEADTRTAMVELVKTVIGEPSEEILPEPERIASFDSDGTALAAVAVE